MLTEFGKMCRKIRIDAGEIMADMADHLQVSAAFLSAVEHGKKPVPVEWPVEISNFYNLDADVFDRLRELADGSIRQVRIDIDENNDSERDFIIAFERNFRNLENSDREKILELLRK